MNLLARILSHGFAIAIVLLLAIGLIYRGQLFPDWELPEFLTLGTQTESDRTDTSAPATPEAPAESVDSESTPEMAAGVEQPAVEAEEAAAGDTEIPAYIPPAEEAEVPESAEVPQATETNELPETPVVSPVIEGAMEPATTPVTTLTDTAAEEPQAPAVEPAAPGDVARAPIEEPAADIAVPADIEPVPASQAIDEAGVAPDLAVPEAAVAEEGQAEQTATLPATLTVESTEPGPEAEPEPEPELASGAADTVPAAMDTGMTEPPALPVAEDTAAVEMPVTEPAVPQAELSAPRVPEMVAPRGAKPAEENAYQILAAAREAYWLRDYATAESKYRQLLALQPDNPDGYGELGNMYFSQGQWEQSAAAYFEAGTRLVKEGQLEQARQLVDVIRGLDGSQADELDALINAAQ